MNMIIVGPEQISAFRAQRDLFESFGDDVTGGMLGPIMIVMGVDEGDDTSGPDFHDHDPNHLTLILPDGQIITDN